MAVEYSKYEYIYKCLSDCISMSYWSLITVKTQPVLSGQQVWWCLPFSTARLWPLSLYIVSVFLRFLSVTVVGYSATVYCLFRVKYVSSLWFERVISFQ